MDGSSGIDICSGRWKWERLETGGLCTRSLSLRFAVTRWQQCLSDGTVPNNSHPLVIPEFFHLLFKNEMQPLY